MVGFSYKPSDYPSANVVYPQVITIAANPERSDWNCYLFGDADKPGPGLVVFNPVKGREPNWFHRKMQELCFGIQWRKKK